MDAKNFEKKTNKFQTVSDFNNNTNFLSKCLFKMSISPKLPIFYSFHEFVL